jgi:alpha-L-fucosidase 2
MESNAWMDRNRQVMPDEAVKFDRKFPDHVARHNVLWTGPSGPPSFWAQGAPLGNGDFGALVYGPPENLSFVLGKTDLWVRRTPKSFFPEGHFADLIKIYRDRDIEAFKRLNTVKGKRPYLFEGSHLTGAGLLRLHLAEPAGLQHFRQELCLADATCRHRFCVPCQGYGYPGTPDFEIESFVSAEAETLVIRARRSSLPMGSFSLRLGRERHPDLPSCIVGAEDGAAWLTQELVKGDRYAIAMRIDGVNAACATGRRSVLVESDEADVREFTIYVACASSNDAADPLALARRRVDAAREKGFDALHTEHARRWEKFWCRSSVSCANREVERRWYVSNYLTGSILRPGKTSPGLQGMWVKENVPAWNADFHANINIQAIYWGVLGSNHVELVEPYGALYHRMLPQCRRDTREYFSAGGARLPHAGDIDGFEMADAYSFFLATSISPGGWVAQLFYWAYLHMMDREYLADVAYPVLRDAAVFYADLLVQMGKGPDGKYRVEPTIYMESAFGKFETWGTNSSYELPIVRVCLEQACRTAGELGADEELAARWKAVLADLPAIPAGDEGVWRSFEGREIPKFGHQASLPFIPPIFPCELASAFHGPRELRGQARATWDNYRSSATPGSWCGGSPIATAARMGDADWAIRAAEYRAEQQLPSGIVSQWQARYVQADDGPGMALAFNSMAVLGLDGTLVLFPGVPAGVDCGFYSLRAPGAVLVSAEQRGGKVLYAALQPCRDGNLRVLNPFAHDAEGNSRRVRVKELLSGKILLEKPLAWREALEFSASADRCYVLEPADAPFADVPMAAAPKD